VARTLAYNQRCAALLPLEPAAAAQLAEANQKLSGALQTVLSL
jgi:hypothetical protein